MGFQIIIYFEIHPATHLFLNECMCLTRAAYESEGRGRRKKNIAQAHNTSMQIARGQKRGMIIGFSAVQLEEEWAQRSIGGDG